MKDAALPPSDINTLYEELVLIVRRMFHVCKLVHADLSEYNIMYHEGHLWIIDVSQSVEHDHPAAFDFLRNDIKNVEDFFGRLGVVTLGLRRCFDFVTKEKLTEEEGVSDEDALKLLVQERVDAKDEEEDVADEKDVRQTPGSTTGSKSKSKIEDAEHEDSIFMKSFIPRTLNEVYDPERDVEKHMRGDELIYADTIGLLNASDKKDIVVTGTSEKKKAVSAVSEAPPKVRFEDAGEDLADGGEGQSDSGTGDEDGSDEDEESGDGKEGFVERKPRGHRHEDKEAKKVDFESSDSAYRI